MLLQFAGYVLSKATTSRNDQIRRMDEKTLAIKIIKGTFPSLARFSRTDLEANRNTGAASTRMNAPQLIWNRK